MRYNYLTSHLHAVVLAPRCHLGGHTLHILDVLQAVVAKQLLAMPVGGFC